MRFLPLLVLASQLAASNAVASSSEQPNPGPVKRDDNGYTKVVSWDKYSLIVNGQRIFVHGGEFHPFRLPVNDQISSIASDLAYASPSIGPRFMDRRIAKVQSCRPQHSFHLFPLVGWNQYYLYTALTFPAGD